MREKVDRLESFVNQLRQTKNVDRDSHDAVSSQKSGQNPNLTTASLAHGGGQLRLTDSGGVHYVGPSHWESIIEDIAEVKAYFDMHSSPESSQNDDLQQSPRSNIFSADILLGVTNGHSKDELLSLLPEKRTVDQLVATWFGTHDALCSIIHVPTFQAEYQSFWLEPSSASQGWTALLFSIAGIGAELLGQVRRDTHMLLLAEDLRRLTSHALILTEYAKPQPYVLEALLTHMKSLLFKCNDVTSELYVLLGTITRLCTQGGYHRDGTHNPRITSLQAEMRRRLWAAVCSYDIKMCYHFGLVSVINHVTQDTLPPSNYTDADLTLDPFPPPRPMHDMTGLTVMLLYNKISHIFGDIIHSTHTTMKSTTAEVAKLDQRLLQAREALPPQLRMKSFADAFLDPLELKMGRYNLEFAHLKAQCVLYQRFISDTSHQEEQQRCLVAARQVVDLMVELLHEAQPGNDVEAALPFLRGYLHDFNLAAMLLCLHLKKPSALSRAARLAVDTEKVLEGCRLWQVHQTNSAKAMSAIRAMSRFLEQRLAMESAAAPVSDAGTVSLPADSHVSRPNAGYVGNVAGPLSGDAYPAPELGMPMTSDPTQGLSTAYYGLDADPDVLFQELFGTEYMPHDGNTAWLS